MRCPECERPTWVAVRVGNEKVRPKTVPQGSVQAALLDGTCFTCRRVQRGDRRPNVRGFVYRHRLTEEEVQQANHAYQRYTARRRTRGVPREGLPPSILVRPGLFLMEVP